VGLPWLEQGTSVLSGLRSNQLSYRPASVAPERTCSNWRVRTKSGALATGRVRERCGVSLPSCEPRPPLPYGSGARHRPGLGRDERVPPCARACAQPDHSRSHHVPRKEVIQPHLPVRLPCYDFTPVTDPTLDSCLPGRTPGWPTGFRCCRLPWCDGRCVQGPGTYSPWCADPRLLATPASCRRVAACNPN
jgi:hypothetical protein